MRDQIAQNKVLFIIGTGRCGSTIVQEMLTRHPDVAFVSNADEYASRLNPKGTWNNMIYGRIPTRLTQRDRVVPTLVQTRLHFGPSEAYRLLERRVGHIISTPFRDLTEEDVTPPMARRFTSFVDERVRAQGKGLFLHKFTGWPRARLLQEIFPQARFIHVIRDGRSVASSLVQRAWWRGHLGPWGWTFGALPDQYRTEWERSGHSFVALAGIEWKIVMDAAQDAKAHIPEDHWMDVRYEDFVSNPRTHVEGMLEWVGLPWSREFESRFVKYSYGQHRKAAYTRDLRPSQVAMLDELLADHLRAYGYAVPTPPAERDQPIETETPSSTPS